VIREDFHTHTTFCDGKNTPEEMVLAAISMGLDALGFSGHGYMGTANSYCMSEENARAYRREIRRLQEVYGDRIRLYCGVEQDYCSLADTLEYDYVIGSVHFFRSGDRWADVDRSAACQRKAADELFGGDPYAMAEAYFADVGDLPNRQRIDLVGHFDLLTKFCERDDLFDQNHPRYRAAATAAMDRLLEAGLPFEINTGAISRGYRTSPYPALWAMEYLGQRGARAVLTGDAHSASALRHEFDRWLPVAEACGLNICSMADILEEKGKHL